MIIDAENAILGRMSVFTAKKLLSGEAVTIVNAEKAIITGDPTTTTQKYHERRDRGTPHHGPFFPKKSNLIVRRTIRGMLPYKTNKGRDAFKKLRVYEGIPENLKDSKFEKVAIKDIASKYITVQTLSKSIGG